VALDFDEHVLVVAFTFAAKSSSAFFVSSDSSLASGLKFATWLVRTVS